MLVSFDFWSLSVDSSLSRRGGCSLVMARCGGFAIRHDWEMDLQSYVHYKHLVGRCVDELQILVFMSVGLQIRHSGKSDISVSGNFSWFPHLYYIYTIFIPTWRMLASYGSLWRICNPTRLRNGFAILCSLQTPRGSMCWRIANPCIHECRIANPTQR